MIKNYENFALFNFGNEYLDKDDINIFNKLYFNNVISKSVKYEIIEKLENDFNNYICTLNEKEFINFFDRIIQIILNKAYMNDHDKAYKIYGIICNGLFGYIEEFRNKYSNFKIFKEYYYNLWDYIIKLSGNDNYLLEKEIGYKHKIYQIYKGLSYDEYNKKLKEKFGKLNNYEGRYKWYGEFLD